MAYDEELADRIRGLIHSEAGVAERRMFGGLAFMVSGNMAVAVSTEGGIMVRVDPAQADALIESRDARVAEMRGRPMRGWLRVAPERLNSDQDLARWVDLGVAFARSMPPKI